MLKFNLFAALMLAFTLLFAGCTESGSTETSEADTTELSTENEEVIAPESGTQIEDTPVEEKKVLPEMFNSSLKTAFESTTLAQTLAEGEYTVFMPTEEALEAIKDKLADPAEAEKIIKNHIVPQKIGLMDMMPDQELETLGGAKLKLSNKGGIMHVNDVEIMEDSDLEASNGYIHKVGKLLN